jgi:DNA-binding IclR family transcriptional regulator
MPVKSSQSASRVLAVFEKIAENQPIGITDLAERMGADKSGVQRALMTLARDGWIRASPGKPTRWELTARIHALASTAQGSHDLRYRARAELLALRDQTQETVTLNVIERSQFVVADVAESQLPLRVVLTVGAIVPAMDSATGRAILPYMSRERQIEFLGVAPGPAQIQAFAEAVRCGYAVSSEIVVPGFTNLGAPIFDTDSRPVGALLVTGPTYRLPEKDYAKVGALISAAARRLSHAKAPRTAELRAMARKPGSDRRVGRRSARPN